MLQLSREGASVNLADIVGYRLDVARCVALPSLHRLLDDTPFRPADATALLLVNERPGCDHTQRLARTGFQPSVGMKVPTRGLKLVRW